MSEKNWNLLDDPHKKLAHQLSNLRVVTLKSKVTAGNEVYLSIGQVAFEGIGCCFLYFSQNTHFSIPRYIVILWYGFCEFHCIFGAESSSDDRLYIFSDECFIINMGRKHNPLLENRLFRFGGE